MKGLGLGLVFAAKKAAVRSAADRCSMEEIDLLGGVMVWRHRPWRRPRTRRLTLLVAS
jgi:hypothetical protein